MRISDIDNYRLLEEVRVLARTIREVKAGIEDTIADFEVLNERISNEENDLRRSLLKQRAGALRQLLYQNRIGNQRAERGLRVLVANLSRRCDIPESELIDLIGGI